MAGEYSLTAAGWRHHLISERALVTTSWRNLRTEPVTDDMATATAQTVELADYWAEFNEACRFDDDTQAYEEGELEAEWLRAAGLGALAAPFAAGREVGAAQLEATLARLPAERASAVRRRVTRLNRTLRRQRGRVTRKPDIRDVFADTESPPYRSRSATPDSLDSAPSGGSSSPPSEWADPSPPNIFENYGPGTKHATLCRAPSAPPGASSPPAASPPRSGHELFKHSDLHWADVASNSEGIELLGYQRFGTVQGPRLGKERINKSILQDQIVLSGKHLSVSRTHSAADTHPQHDQLLSFQHKFRSDFEISSCTEEWPEIDSNTHVDEISEAQIKKLIPLLWLDLAALFDKYNIAFRKRKPAKKKKKEENNIFGVSLLALLRKDYIICEDTSSMVPRAIRCLTQALHGHITEEGIFRLTGNKQKIENLCNIMERYFYEDAPLVEQTIAHSACHDIATTLKRFLRDLPQTLLTTELVQLFYQTSTLSGGVQGRAHNLLVLLLPTEHRAALLHILQLMNDIASHHTENKMTLHNIAMIMAPTFFPPNLVIKPTDTLDMQLQVAANSCRVTEALMRLESKLWFVPYSLMIAIERKNGHRRRVHRNSNTET